MKDYFMKLWHDIRMAVEHFRYIRRHLRNGGNPDDAGNI